jgi:hypothetical protein
MDVKTRRTVMWRRLRRRAAALNGVQFCDECGQVCTSECRSQARIDRVRNEVALQVFPRDNLKTEDTMTTESTTKPVGGFAGDPAEAFQPPVASGCCGGPAPATTSPSQPATTCCGTVAQAQAEGSCCGSAAKQDAVAAGTGCCG